MARAKARLCAISKDKLRQPIVICRMGLLYNKEEMIKRLIEKNIPKAFRHIKKLKDVKEAQIQVRKNEGDDSIVIQCPISQIEFNGFHKFIINWSCGCVISQEAQRELKDQQKCISCGEEVKSQEDVISLNQTPDEQLAFLRDFDEQQRIADEKAASKKANKKRTKRENPDADNLDDNEEVKEGDAKRQKLDDKHKEAVPEKSDAYKSLFTKQYEENKDADFLCRCVHRGLR
ncbi:rtf2 domain containing protein [Stylonychia lemnae]|uniref:Rtf2 domain containing protein n=1 Tax=Stylonychia lemnae TaxID=5949 RepID=A0A078AMC7_STYLE|nr:rtf2 domain containing protein [Stylonychia lemnae]|eukprot:CDW82542.1 rtf2 domain containing protein [Stylonychia lemnae]